MEQKYLWYHHCKCQSPRYRVSLEFMSRAQFIRKLLPELLFFSGAALAFFNKPTLFPSRF